MQPTIEILERIKLNSQSNKDEVFTRLFRYMLRPDIYYVAYQHLYANKGAATKGINEDTADGFGEEKVAKIIKLLSTDQYVPSPVRRTYIQKKNSDKMRPLGIPTFTDKLVQEVLRMILEAVYEPIFYDCSHGFRPNRSCHTALKEIQHRFTGIRWFIEGDIKGCFDNIDHSVLTNCITHSSQKARFLGYDVRVRRDGKIKPGGLGYTKRTLNNKVELSIPLTDKIQKFLFQKKIVKQNEAGKLEPIHRKELLRTTELEIVSAYNAELRGICNYYQLASNFHNLNYFAYLMEYSCLKTLAAKHKCKTTKIRQMYKDGHGGWSIPYMTKKGEKRMYFAKYSDGRKKAKCNDVISNVASMHKNAVTSFEDRLKANICELCGTTSGKHYEIHHVNKLKNLKGKEAWEVVMLAKRRKTIVLCRMCHKKIHQPRV